MALPFFGRSRGNARRRRGTGDSWPSPYVVNEHGLGTDPGPVPWTGSTRDSSAKIGEGRFQAYSAGGFPKGDALEKRDAAAD